MTGLARAARAALAGICLAGAAGIALPLVPAAGAWSEFGVEKPAKTAPGPEVREPFFDFLLSMVAADSIGQWTGADVARFAASSGRESRFPLEEFVSLQRSRPDSLAAVRYEGAVVRAVWRLVLTGPQDRPMPYSILGYHPGSLRLGGELVLSETAPQDLTLWCRIDGKSVPQVVTEARIFALEQGYVLLDADGWLDALLGAGLDDSWSLGFVTAREEGRPLGLGVSVGREGRGIYGEFDFARDAVIAHGRPLADALSKASRQWLDPALGNLPVPWSQP